MLQVSGFICLIQEVRIEYSDFYKNWVIRTGARPSCFITHLMCRLVVVANQKNGPVRWLLPAGPFGD
jgi:hypothetical protein